MSTDLYRDILKDRNQLDQTNPRTRSLGGLTSSDYQYKNFLSGMKPRGNSHSHIESNRQSSSFVDSAVRTTSGGKLNLKGDIEHEDEKAKAHKARYAELSHAPSKKSSDTFSPRSPLQSSSGIELGSSSKVQTESLGSVGMLRSLFDKNPDETRPRLRSSSGGKKHERPLSTGFDFDKKSKVSGVYEKQSNQEKRKSVDVNELTKLADKNDVDGSSDINKGENGYSSTEIKDDVNPKGNKIDVSYIMAPDEETDIKGSEEEDISSVTSKKLDDDLQKKLEVERLKRTHEEVIIEKRFNVKRRSLKERLSLLASEEDPYSFQTSDTFYNVNSPELPDDHDVFMKNASIDLPKEETTHDDVQINHEEAVNEAGSDNQTEEAVNEGRSDDQMEPTSDSPYKSAVERFDEFITKEEIVPDSSSPENSNTDFNDNIVKLQEGVALEENSSTDLSSNELGNEDENLMDSILQHMEKTDSSKNIGQEYISLLRNESFSETDVSNDVAKPDDKTVVSEPVKETTATLVHERPAVLPRLSKQQGYNQVLPSPTREEEKVLVSKHNHVNTLPTLSEGSTASAGSKSSTENESTDTGSNDELPPEPQVKQMPQKSNLKMKPREEKRKVLFKLKNLQQVGYTYGKYEYNRANIDIDPIASSAEWELEKRVENMDIFSIDLHKDERGLGLSIIGLGVGTESGVEKLGIFVKTLTDKGAAQKDGRIQVNDQILEVNGVSLVGVTQYFAAQTLKGTNGVVKFLMGREKSRHSHLSPGAPLQLQPDMQQHIEEMNKMLAQLDETEERAVSAENTLEDVKRELLKAEERAHEAEQQMNEMKEQLKAVTESPFVGNQRKMKNEIKKRGGKQEKVEELQRNLKNVTNRLSASEENLLQLTSVTDGKDKEMEALQLKIDESDALQKQFKELNNKLQVELANKIAEMEKIKLDSDQIQQQLEDRIKGYDEAKQVQESQHSEKLKLSVEKEKELTFKVVASENQANELKENLLEMERKLKEKEEMTIAVGEYNKAQQTIKHLKSLLKASEEKVEELEKSSRSKDEEIGKLEEKINYLQSLILKLDKSTVEDEEKCYMLENEELKKKIVILEVDLDNKKKKYFQDVVVNEEISVASQLELESAPDIKTTELPDLPDRVNANTTDISPPLISRDCKPASEAIESNHDNIAATPNVDISFDEPGVLGETPPNPVPKPPRGHFIDTEEEDFVIVEKVEDTESPVGKLKPNLSLDLTSITSHTDSENNTEKQEILLDNSYLVQGVSDSIIIAAVAEASTPEREKPIVDMQMKYLQQSPQKFEEDLPKEESGIDVHLEGDGEGDLGEFQLITEDVQEEHSTPDTFVARKNITKDKDNRSSFFEALNREPGFNNWLDEEWKRLDSQAREEQAEKIAAQVTAKSPKKKRISHASSSSSEDDEGGDELDTPHSAKTPSWKKQSIQIDASYFQKSTKIESFDQGISILDDDSAAAAEKDVTVVKSLSFDSVIPPTPVLDNQLALTKREIVKQNEKRKPTQGARGSLAGVVDDFQINTLPRKKTAQSTPNLATTGAISTPDLIQSSTSSSSIEKPEKQKHKFGFHLPKVFKKGKLNKKPSFDEKTPSVITNEVKAPPSSSPASTHSNDFKNTSDVPVVVVSLESSNHSSHLSPLNDAEVVPIDEKNDAIKQQMANDVGTEEAVVPFADKEMLMDKAMKETKEDHHREDQNGSPAFIAPIDAENSNTKESKTTSLDDVEIELSPSHSVSSPSENSSVTGDLPPVDGNHQSAFNERGIDVDVGNANDREEDEEITHWTRRAPNDWDVRQVGLWLVEMNLSQYVNNFKSHNVDGQALLRADGNRLKDYGVGNYDHRAEIKKRIKEFRQKLSKDSFNKGKIKDHKSTKDKLQFWKGKYKVPH